MYTIRMNTEKVAALSGIFTSALDAVRPANVLKGHADSIHAAFRNAGCKKLYVAGFGKASCQMAKALEGSLDIPVDRGILVTKYDHCRGIRLKNFDIYEAGHPIPDMQGVAATQKVARLLKSAGRDTLVVCLISGGGSALLASPVTGISLEEKQKATDLLLKSGADIYALNTVRKHISRVKGGRLAEIAYPAKVLSLIVSDVVGDRLDVIASGPTSPDPTTYRSALSAVRKAGVMKEFPPNVLDILTRGKEGRLPETPKKNNALFRNVTNLIIGNNGRAVAAAHDRALREQCEVQVIPVPVTGEAREAGRYLARHARMVHDHNVRMQHKKKVCVISGGETTVTVRGAGKGGRNTELALAFALETDGIKGISLLSAGTDGTDGPTDAAGAFADGTTIKRSRETGLDAMRFLEENDSYVFFRRLGDLLKTGATGTNVMDLQIMLIE